MNRSELNQDDFQFHTDTEFRMEDYMELENHLMQIQHPAHDAFSL